MLGLGSASSACLRQAVVIGGSPADCRASPFVVVGNGPSLWRFNRAFKPYLPSPGHVWNGMYGHFQGPPSYDGSAPFFCHGPSFAACFGGIRPAALTLVCRRVFRCSPRLPGRPLLAALLRVFLHLGALFNVIGVLFKLTFYCYQAQPSLTGASAFGDATPSLLACP